MVVVERKLVELITIIFLFVVARSFTTSSETRWYLACSGAQCWRRLECTGETIVIFGLPDDLSDDLEQVMREVCKVKICELSVLDFFDEQPLKMKMSQER